MPELKDIIAAMSAAAKENLVRAGFRKREGDLFTYELSDRALGWVGLNRATYNSRGPLDVNPVVGVRDQEIERLLAECVGERFHPYLPPTVSTPLGYVMPERSYKLRTFETLDSVPSQVKDMTEAIVTYGLPFMRDTSSREALIALMRSKPGNEMFFYRLPLVLWLEGSTEEAYAMVAQTMAEVWNRSNIFAEQYRRFAAGFRKRTLR